MKLTPPFPLNTISQGFADNAVSMYAGQGLRGHTGIDFAPANCFDMPMPSSADSYCYSTQNNADTSQYRAVYTLVDETDFSYEISYGHCNQIHAKIGDTVTDGQIIATVGNTGAVFVGGVAVTDRSTGSGSHLHYQVRKCKRVTTTTSGKQYLRTANGKYKNGLYYYEVVDADNGYNGCIDPMPFFSTQYLFTNNLRYGQTSQDVLELQKRLGVDYSTAPGYFGLRTLAAVVAYQRANNIYPAWGFVWPLTRASLNNA
mgnify:FL=1